MLNTMLQQSDLLRRAEDFLFQEADLMDRGQYDAWMELWDADATYWVPCNSEDLDPQRSVSLIYEHREQIEDRLFRLKGRHAHAQSPKSRLIRVVSNVRVVQAEGELVTVTSTFVLGEVRLERQNVFFGRSTHVLLDQESGFKMREKKVFLLNNDTAMGNVTFLV